MHALLLIPLLLAEMSSYRDASALVDRAIALRKHSLVPISLEIEATVRQLHQSPYPREPYLETKLRQVVAADPAARRFVIDETSLWPYFTSHTTVRIDGREMLTVRHGNATHALTADGLDSAIARVTRRHPHLLLDGAQRHRASLRLASADTIRFVAEDGGVLSVKFDSGKIVRAEWLAYDDVFGDMRHQIDYQWDASGPTGFRQFENGQLMMTGRYRDVRHGSDVAIPMVDVPSASTLSSPAPVPPPQIENLAQDVFLIRNAGGPDYHSLLVRFRDRIVIVEGPRSPEHGRAAIAAVRGWDRERSIDQLVITHHHDDHIGGIRAYAEAGAEILTTPGNVNLVRSILEAPHTIEPAQRVEARVVAVTSGDRITDGVNDLVLLDAGPNDHSAESLVAWLPRQQIIFQGDLFRYDPARPEAARNAAVAFSEFITRRELPVKIIAGVHGEPATPAHLREAIQRRTAK